MRNIIKVMVLLIALPLTAPIAAETVADGTGYVAERTYPAAVRLWAPKAAQEDPSAQYNLGIQYYGGDGVRQDDTQAAKWFRKAAAQGYAPAQYSLGLMHLDGLGVRRDHSEAARLFRAAAEQGNPGAQYRLAMLYFQGQGISADYVAAYKWLTLVAERGNELASEKRQTVASRMAPDEIAVARRLAEEWQLQ